MAYRSHFYFSPSRRALDRPLLADRADGRSVGLWWREREREGRTAKCWSPSAGTENPRWRRAAILETADSRHIRNRLADFDRIRHGNACRPSGPYRTLTFRMFFLNQRWRKAAILKVNNRDISTTAPLKLRPYGAIQICLLLFYYYLQEIWHRDAEWVSQLHRRLKN